MTPTPSTPKREPAEKWCRVCASKQGQPFRIYFGHSIEGRMWCCSQRCMDKYNSGGGR